MMTLTTTHFRSRETFKGSLGWMTPFMLIEDEYDPDAARILWIETRDI